MEKAAVRGSRVFLSMVPAWSTRKPTSSTRPPYFLRAAIRGKYGVQRSAPGVRFDDVSTFCDLGRVGVGKCASYNILSVCQMVDNGKAFRHDIDKDEFIVVGTNQD